MAGEPPRALDQAPTVLRTWTKFTNNSLGLARSIMASAA